MNNFIIFVVGLAITLIAGMGVITSSVFIGYKKYTKTTENLKDLGVAVSK